MNYLLDTHTFLWFINNDPALSHVAKSIIADPANAIYLSTASVWEMAIKVSLNRLAMPLPFADFIDNQMRVNSVTLLTITTRHTGIVSTLPFHHRDPFDRLIIAQALHENYPVIGRDAAFDPYGVQRYW